MICRLCLITIDVDNKVLIFTSCDNDAESQIVKLIAKYFNLEVTQHDAISTTLCRDCWNHIDEFHKFWTFVDEKQSTLRNEFLEVKCDVLLRTEDVDVDNEQNEESLCNMKDVLQEPLEVQIKSEPDEKNIFEETAPSLDDDAEFSEDNIPLQKLKKRSTRKRTLIKAFNIEPTKKTKAKKIRGAKKTKQLIKTKPMEKKKIERKKPIFKNENDNDDDCEREEPDDRRDDDYLPDDEDVAEYEHETDIQNDAQSLDDALSDGEQSSTSAIKKRKTKYPKKPKSTESLEEMDVFITQNMQMKCDLCDVHFEKFVDARSHYRDQHKRREYIKCCGIHHGRARDLFEHIKWHFDKEYFKCDTCGKLLKSSNSLEMHKITKHLKGEELVFNCEYCNKRFARPFMLKNHVKNTHEAKRNFACQHCDKRFTLKYALVKHIQSMHDNVFPYICDMCGMKFKFKPSFETHVLEHKGIIEPPVQCSECGVWTKNKNCLRTHMTTHNKVDVHCKYCGRVCASLSAMRAHIQKMHRRPPSYKCTYCDKLVKTPKDLKEHIATHTGENLYSCPHCIKEFRSSSNMYVHIKRLHTQEWLAARLERPRKAPNVES